jgi:hypothetical protein
MFFLDYWYKTINCSDWTALGFCEAIYEDHQGEIDREQAAEFYLNDLDVIFDRVEERNQNIVAKVVKLRNSFDKGDPLFEAFWLNHQ